MEQMDKLGQPNPDPVAFFLMLGCAAMICLVLGWVLGFRSGRKEGYKEGYAKGCEDFLTPPAPVDSWEDEQ